MAEREAGINLHDSSMRPIYDCDLVDRISALPDSIMSLILSILPTKNAVATSILSKRWKFAWATVHNLDFCCLSLREEDNESEIMKFVPFVNRVLLLSDAGLLNKFSLQCNFGLISTHVSSWINTAIMKNVREISLFHTALDGQFEMPTSAFNCSSLRSLDLTGDFNVTAAIADFLPRLETLTLNGVGFPSEEAFENLISGLPMLNYLDLYMYQADVVTAYVISSTSLRRLDIMSEGGCSLKLNTLSLEYLTVVGGISDFFVQKCLSSLVEVDFQIYYDGSDNSLIEAVRAFDCAKALTLSHDVMWALSQATICLSTEFKRLVKLEIETSSSLEYFIRYADNLQVLTIDEGLHFGPRCWDSPVEVPRCWDSPVEVPRCFSNSLKTVIVVNYHGYEDERETIRYILKHGIVLEVMQISCLRSVDDSAVLKLVKEICEFPRKSPVCEVKFL